MEYEAGLLKAWPKPSTSLSPEAPRTPYLIPCRQAAFQMKHPMTMMLRRLLLSCPPHG